MIEDKDILPYNFFAYQGIFTGSEGSKRYKIQRAGEKPEFKLVVSVWEGPYASDYVPDEEKLSAEFEASEEGRLCAIAWLNEQCAKP